MVKIKGVETQKDSNGQVTHITIDIQQHKEAIPILKELGLMEKTPFEQDCEEGMSIEEFGERIQKHIDSLQWQE